MKIVCISSLKYPVNKGYEEGEPVNDATDVLDFYDNCEQYAYTELFIGYKMEDTRNSLTGERDKSYVLRLLRSDSYYPLDFRLTNVETYVSRVVDIQKTILKNDTFLIIKAVEDEIPMEIYVRFIKAKPKKNPKSRTVEKLAIYHFCERIKQFSNADYSNIEQCPLLTEPFPGEEHLSKKQFEDEKKARGAKVASLVYAVNYHVKGGQYSRYETGRIDQSLEKYSFEKKKHFYKENSKKYSMYVKHPVLEDVLSLELSDFYVKEIEPNWFNPFLTQLEFTNIGLFKTLDDKKWQMFADKLKGCVYLSILSIFNEQIEYIPECVFDSLSETKFRQLSLGRNNLREIPRNISRLRGLAMLQMDYNEEFAPEDAFWESLPPKLNSVHLNNTGITRIPAAVKRLRYLSYISYENCPNLKHITWEFMPLTSISVDNGINPPPTCFKYKVLDMPRVESTFSLIAKNVDWRDFDFTFLPLNTSFVEFDYTKILEPPKILKRLNKLGNFKLNHVRLGEESEETAECAKTLHFYHFPASIKDIYMEVGILEHVIFPDPDYWEWINVVDEQIHHVQHWHCPPEFDVIPLDFKKQEEYLKLLEYNGKIPELAELYLVDHKLEEFGQNIDVFRTLAIIDLSNNKLTKLHPDFALLKNLKFLALQGNFLTELPRGLEDITKLQHLDVQYNKLNVDDADPQNIFTRLWDRIPKEVQSVELDGNDVRFLACTLKMCKEISAEKCSLQNMCPKLKNRINIQNNPDMNALPFLPSHCFDEDIDKTFRILTAFSNFDSNSAHLSAPVLLDCQCCANSNCTSSLPTYGYKNRLKMDFVLKITKRKKKEIDIDDFKRINRFKNLAGGRLKYETDESGQITKYYYYLTYYGKYAVKQPGDWSANVNTKLCSGCLGTVRGAELSKKQCRELERGVVEVDLVQEIDRMEVDSSSLTETNAVPAQQMQFQLPQYPQHLPNAHYNVDDAYQWDPVISQNDTVVHQTSQNYYTASAHADQYQSAYHPQALEYIHYQTSLYVDQYNPAQNDGIYYAPGYGGILDQQATVYGYPQHQTYTHQQPGYYGGYPNNLFYGTNPAVGQIPLNQNPTDFQQPCFDQQQASQMSDPNAVPISGQTTHNHPHNRDFQANADYFHIDASNKESGS